MIYAIKFVAVGIFCAVAALVVRQLKPEIAPFVQLSGIVVTAVFAMDFVDSILTQSTELFEGYGVVNAEYLSLLVKVLGIGVLTKTGADICNDSGNSALSTVTELAGRVLITALCFPLIKTIVQFAVGLLD